MKTLKELKNECKLIAEFKNPNFIGKATDDCYDYKRANKCALYGDNKGKFYLFKCIKGHEIQEYENYEIAIERFTTFVNIMLQR